MHIVYERLVLFVLQAVVDNVRASRNLESISLSRGGGNKQEGRESGRRIDRKKYFCLYISSAVMKKNASVGKQFCVAGVATEYGTAV